MTVYNLGSINIDHVYRVPHLPQPGETLAASGYSRGLGGKGANQSVAAARMGARAVHIGAVGPDGADMLAGLRGFGVETTGVAEVAAPTGHANIYVDDAGENSIVILDGANRDFDAAAIAAALEEAGPEDILLVQNEIDHQARAAALAQARGMRVIYSAAPFDIAAVQAVLPHITTLALNAGEAAALAAALNCRLEEVPVRELLVTRGAEGAEWIGTATGQRLFQPSFPVQPVDTTGAGDTFAGAFAAALDEGQDAGGALRLAAAAAALQVTRPGAAGAIPDRAEVEAFLALHR